MGGSFGNPIGETLRQRRVDGMGKSLRDTAKLLEITPAHLTDIETGKRSPSEELLKRIAKVYAIEEAILRAGWRKPDLSVADVATRNPTNAEKAPEFLLAARDLSAEQWDALIAKAKSLAAKSNRKSTRNSN